MSIYLKYNYKIYNKSINRIVLRLRRRGISFYPVYDLIVIKKKKRSKGRALERIGFFNPHSKERFLFLDSSKLEFWLSKGLYVHKSVKRYFLKFLIVKK